MNTVSATPLRKRRAFSLPGENLRLDGDAHWTERLGQALLIPGLPERIAPDDRPLLERSLGPHLFHSYAGRTHPLLVRQLCADLVPGQVLLDPFAGSGTVPIEAVRLGAQAVGLDLSPLAVRLSTAKATPLPASMQQALLSAAEQACRQSIERVKKRLSPPRNYDDPTHYAPHVYLELGGLRYAIEQIQRSDAPLAELLLMVFSAIVVKASKQRSETDPRTIDRQLAKGQVTRWFLAKAQEFVRLKNAFSSQVEKPPKPLLFVGDARADLCASRHRVFSENTVHRVVTSPPYLGTFDYVWHHARRYAWLSIDPTPFEQHEMAARRHALPLSKRVSLHEADTWTWLCAVERLLVPAGLVFVLVGDSVVQETLCDGAQPILRAAESTSLRCLAQASVERPHVVPNSQLLPARREHLLLLQKR